MATEKQIAANRLNSRKCTGPKTNQGKFKSSLNALRQGLYSHNYIIKTEDAAVFENFSKSFIDEFKPATPAELENLKVLIIAAWRRNRVTELIQSRIDKAIDSVPHSPETISASQLTILAFEHLEMEKPSFARQEAHEIRLANLFQRTQRRLEASQDRKIRNETNFAQDRLTFAA